MTQPLSPAREALLEALDRLRPELYDLSQQTSPFTPESNPEDFEREEIEQFLNAYEALVREALTGQGRATRDLIFDTALPAIFAEVGQPVGAMVSSSVALTVVVAHRLLADVPAELRDEAALWLSEFYSGYTRELFERYAALWESGS